MGGILAFFFAAATGVEKILREQDGDGGRGTNVDLEQEKMKERRTPNRSIIPKFWQV